MGDRYILFGPLNEVCMRTEVDVAEPTNEALKRTVKAMREHGTKVSEFWYDSSAVRDKVISMFWLFGGFADSLEIALHNRCL